MRPMREQVLPYPMQIIEISWQSGESSKSEHLSRTRKGTAFCAGAYGEAYRHYAGEWREAEKEFVRLVYAQFKNI